MGIDAQCNQSNGIEAADGLVFRATFEAAIHTYFILPPYHRGQTSLHCSLEFVVEETFFGFVTRGTALQRAAVKTRRMLVARSSHVFISKMFVMVSHAN